MIVDNHALHLDFPKYKEKISVLASQNAKFKILLEDYNKITKTIQGLESRHIPSNDGHFTIMKIERAHLKDKLYQHLTKVH